MRKSVKEMDEFVKPSNIPVTVTSLVGVTFSTY
jgi:hypothetical protein